MAGHLYTPNREQHRTSMPCLGLECRPNHVGSGVNHIGSKFNYISRCNSALVVCNVDWLLLTSYSDMYINKVLEYSEYVCSYSEKIRLLLK